MRKTGAMTVTPDLRPQRKVSFAAAARILAERDPVIARLFAQTGPPRLPRPSETHLATLVRAIVYQQLATRAAAAIHDQFQTFRITTNAITPVTTIVPVTAIP